MNNLNGWCIALYIKYPQYREVQQRILHYYQFREGKNYLSAWAVEPSSHWWRKYKDKKRASFVLHKIIKECDEVKAGFVFRSDDFSNEDYFMWQSPTEKKIYRELFRENYKKILSEILGIKWRRLNDEYLSLIHI